MIERSGTAASTPPADPVPGQGGLLLAPVLAVAALAVTLFFVWWWAPVQTPVELRVPGTDRPAGTAGEGPSGSAFAAAVTVTGPGQPASLPGLWPGFRGPGRDGRSVDETPLATEWAGGRLKELWRVEVGEGFAGPAVAEGRVFLMDYDREGQKDALRCLSLDDGREIWRLAYPMAVKRNHGISRTVPTVAGGLVVAMGPKCHVLAAEMTEGRLRWGLDLVKEFGAVVPPWYTGQCPLVDGDLVILAPGGPSALMVAVERDTGKVRWTTPNPQEWKMTHASIVPLQLDARRYYLYCASGGVVAVSADDGAIAWETASWKISIATVPSPVVMDDGRVMFTGGYGAGAALFQFRHDDGRLRGTEVWRVKPDVFGATQHSPVWQGGHLYGIRADGRLVCVTPEGRVAWESPAEATFGLGPLLVAQGLIYALAEGGKLTLADARPDAFRQRAQAEVIADGHECWAPLALAGPRLIVRDLTRMVCLQVGP